MDASLHKRAEQLATEFASQARTAEDLNGLMRLMMKSGLGRMVKTEMGGHLGRRPSSPAAVAELASEGLPPCGEPALANEANPRKDSRNRRHGKSPKHVQGDLGGLTIDTPRDRDGTFEPVLIPKHQRSLPGFDETTL